MGGSYQIVDVRSAPRVVLPWIEETGKDSTPGEGWRTMNVDQDKFNEVSEPVTLEEDDEFEEFETQEWVQEEEDLADTERWENDWDDDDISDDFSKQLKEELEKVRSETFSGSAPADGVPGI